MSSSNKKSFEKSLKRIQEIVDILEEGEADLEKSLALFEEGAGLIKECSKELDDAEQKLSLLVKGEDGPVFENFDKDN
ncbi:MAG: exodeoxyribonuclease VII small subunit [Clostridia bacterium]|nr:exodeoxyribonuclease VII small subunit [Clostridia bacterium]